jgi:hypothetical protein
VRFDNNKYSVAASAVGRPVEVHAYADRIVIRQDGRIVGEHPRSFGRGDTIYDPWHYVPVLARKPGALRNGAPFKDWVLPATMERVRRKLAGVDDGNRQMVDILTAVITDGLPAVQAACAEAIAQGVHSADVVLNILARHRNPGPPATILTPAGAVDGRPDRPQGCRILLRRDRATTGRHVLRLTDGNDHRQRGAATSQSGDRQPPGVTLDEVIQVIKDGLTGAT